MPYTSTVLEAVILVILIRSVNPSILGLGNPVSSSDFSVLYPLRTDLYLHRLARPLHTPYSSLSSHSSYLLHFIFAFFYGKMAGPDAEFLSSLSPQGFYPTVLLLAGPLTGQHLHLHLHLHDPN